MKIFKKVWAWIEGLWNDLDHQIEKLLPVATNVVQAVKTAIENKNFDMVTTVIKNLIPGQTDDVIIDKAVELARKHIPQLAIQLEIYNVIADISDPREQLIAVFEKLQTASGEKWQKFCTQLAQQVLVDMSDGKITWGEAGVYVELYYKTYIKK